MQISCFSYQSTCFRPPSYLGKTAQASASQSNNKKIIAVSFLSAIQIKLHHRIRNTMVLLGMGTLLHSKFFILWAVCVKLVSCNMVIIDLKSYAYFIHSKLYQLYVIMPLLWLNFQRKMLCLCYSI